MAFEYFHSLSKKNQRIYQASDAVRSVELPVDMLPGLQAIAARLQPVLASDKRLQVSKIVNELVSALCAALRIQPVQVIVRNVRPSSHAGELHGLYTRHSDGRCKIEVWMRTAQHARVVAYRTFLRTLLHEVGHHLDYMHFGFGDSFHCEGFFRRESDLVRKLAAPSAPRSREKVPAATPPRAAKPARPAPPQLSFDF